VLAMSLDACKSASMDAWDLQADFPVQIGKGCVDSLPQSQQGCESQVPFHLVPSSQTGCGEAPAACWSVTQHQGVRPEQTPLPPQQPQVLACRQPEYAYAGWLPQTAPGTPQPISGRSLLGRLTVAACNLPSDLPVLPQPAAAPRVPQGVVKQPQHAQPSPEAGALGQLTALPPADGRLAAPVSNMCLETYCQIHSLLTGGGSPVVQQLHALQSSAVRSQDLKQVRHMNPHAWSGSHDGLASTCTLMSVPEWIQTVAHALMQVLYMHGHAVGSKTKQVQAICNQPCTCGTLCGVCCSM
jgi:hypothetical protein